MFRETTEADIDNMIIDPNSDFGSWVPFIYYFMIGAQFALVSVIGA